MSIKRLYDSIFGYTKHYFAGTERLASAIGNGGLADVGHPIVGSDVLADKLRERDTLLFRMMEPYPLRINRNRLDTLYAMTRPDTTAELTYFFHPDHLGSASWITDLSGQPVQHLQYKPFGGDYINQQDPNTEYSERFRFTGKERDAETGYDYFGARYYSSSLGIWLSVDPMSDKYPSLSPYIYCADNPMRLVDLKGDTIKSAGEAEAADYKAYYDKVSSNEQEYGFIKKELDRLEGAKEVFRIRKGKNTTSKAGGGNFIYNKETQEFDVNIADYGDFNTMEKIAHELKHADQYMDGKLGFMIVDNQVIPISFDFMDEREAYNRQSMFSDKNKLFSDDFIRERYNSFSYSNKNPSFSESEIYTMEQHNLRYSADNVGKNNKFFIFKAP